MADRIKAVQRMFWALLAASAAVALLGIPVGDDANTMDALLELTAFQEKFDRPALERALIAHASAQGVVRLDQVAGKIGGKGAPKVSAAAAAQPVQPSAGVALATLERIHALGREGSTLEIGTASADSLALALGWRLTRREGEKRHELTGIRLTDRACSEQDLAREREVEDARQTALASKADFAKAEKRHGDAQKLSELRRKWKAPWKAILRADQRRDELLVEKDQAEQTMKRDEERYQTLAAQAENAGREEPAAAGQGGCVLAAATLRALPSGEAVELLLPTQVERRAVRVPPLTGVDFEVTHAAGLWDELHGESVDAAIARLEQRFSWHYRHAEIAGVPVGGMTVLQFAPLVLLPIFFGLIRRSRGLGALYNPFDRPKVEDLPTVGFGGLAPNLLVLIALPLAACALCTWSLLQIDSLPIVPLLCAIGSLALGARSHSALNDLLELRDAITRSHSNPPPAPTTT